MNAILAAQHHNPALAIFLVVCIFVMLGFAALLLFGGRR